MNTVQSCGRCSKLTFINKSLRRTAKNPDVPLLIFHSVYNLDFSMFSGCLSVRTAETGGYRFACLQELLLPEIGGNTVEKNCCMLIGGDCPFLGEICYDKTETT